MSLITTDKETCECRVIHEKRVQHARNTDLEAADRDRLANLFKAMGDPTRLKILHALREGEMCVCDLALFLGISESAVSHQLRNLRQISLIANRRDGPILYYRLNDRHIEQLINLGLEHVRE